MRAAPVLRAALLMLAILGLSAATDSAARAGEAPRAIDAIEDDLVADDPAVRAKASTELTDRFPDGAVAVPMLVDLLDDESPEVVAAAARAIDSMAIAGAPFLVRVLTDEDDDRAGDALATLYRMARREDGGPSDSLLPQTGKPRLPPDPVTFASVALNDWTQRDPLRSREAMLLLCEFVRRSRPELQALAGATLAFLAADCVEARRIVPVDDPARARAVTAAVPLLRSSNPVKVWAGARILERIRPTTEEGIDALLKLTHKPVASDWWLAWYACEALSAAGPAAAPAASRLLEMTHELNGIIAVRTLIRIGRERDAVRLLESMHPESVTIAAELAREGRAAEIVIPLLLAAEPRDAYLTLPALAALGTSAKSALPELRTRFEAAPSLELASAILAIAPDDTPATDFVVAALDGRGGSNAEYRKACWAVVGQRAGPSANVLARVHDAIVAAVRRDGRTEMMDALKATARFGNAAAFMAPDLDRLAVAEEKRRAEKPAALYVSIARELIAVALGRIGPDASVAVRRLEKWKSNGDETIRVPAAQALRRIKAK